MRFLDGVFEFADFALKLMIMFAIRVEFFVEFFDAPLQPVKFLVKRAHKNKNDGSTNRAEYRAQVTYDLQMFHVTSPSFELI